MKFSSLSFYAIAGMLSLSTSALGDWGSPIQCGVETKIGEAKSQVDSLSGTTFGRLTKQIVSSSVKSTGAVSKDVFNYEIQVLLTSTNTYTLKIKNINQDETLSTQVLVPNGESVDQEMTLTKNYPAVNGIVVLFPRFKMVLKCLLRSQGATSIPEVTPGPPSQM